MVRRRLGELLELERRILEITARRDEVHGFALAADLASGDDKKRLIGHGTLYKALDRLREQGYLESRWEDPADSAREGRPRRRLYRITDAGRIAVATSDRGRSKASAPREATS